MTAFFSAGLVSTVDFREAMSQFATCVMVVTTPGPVGCTATAVSCVSADQPGGGISLRTGSRTMAVTGRRDIRGERAGHAPAGLTTRFAADRDHRFDGVAVHRRRRLLAFADAATRVVCRAHDRLPLLHHTL